MFGELVREKRSKRGYSLQKVCDLCSIDISPSYIYLLESGKRKNPSFQICVELCKVLQIKLIDLFTAFGYKDMYYQMMREIDK